RRVGHVLEVVVTPRDTHGGADLAGRQVEQTTLRGGFHDVLRQARAVGVVAAQRIDAVLGDFSHAKDRQPRGALQAGGGRTGDVGATAEVRRTGQRTPAFGGDPADVV